MRYITSLLLVFSLLMVSCEGDQGPPGLPGPQGPAGETAPSFTVRGVNFTPQNDYFFIDQFPVEVFDGEVVLAYILWNRDEGIWRQLPQTAYFQDGSELVYNFDFTTFDFSLFLDGTANFNLLDPSFTLNQDFRFVIVPTDDLGFVDFTDINAVINKYGIENFEELQIQ